MPTTAPESDAAPATTERVPQQREARRRGGLRTPPLLLEPVAMGAPAHAMLPRSHRAPAPTYAPLGRNLVWDVGLLLLTLLTLVIAFLALRS